MEVNDGVEGGGEGGVDGAVDRGADSRAALTGWASSGAMALTGRADGQPLGPPALLVERLSTAAGVVRDLSRLMGRAVSPDPLRLLTQRAAIAGLHRRGTVSCGGSTRLLPCSDGWTALSLARPEDVELIPAWLGGSVPDGTDPWPWIAVRVAKERALDVVAAGALLGLPVAAHDSFPALPHGSTDSSLPFVGQRLGEVPPTTGLRGLVVADLSSLWAGPLCGSLLASAGAEVWKVESTSRPDGSRHGPAAFFDLLNGGKRGVSVDLGTDTGRRRLREVVARADVVIEASRPRALEHLGIYAEEVLRVGGPRVWLSITAYGRAPDGRDRVGFGDDTAVAGGLVCWDGEVPCFCVDAVADPATGLVAAAATLETLSLGGSWLLDVSLAGVAAHLAGPTVPVGSGTTPSPPPIPLVGERGPELGSDDDYVSARLAAER